MSAKMEGKVVLITGANSGIGEASAVALRQAGATVFGLVRRKEALEESRRKHADIHWVLADVTKAAEVKAAIDSVVQEAGRLDVLVNNAAIFAFAPIEMTNEAAIRGMFDTNVYGLVFATQAALPALKKSRGSILNISSAAGHHAAPNGSIYGATKAAVESLTRSWALELATTGVRVNAIAPGPTDTAGFDKLGMPADAAKAEFVKKVPLGRISTPAEVAYLVVALADPAVAYMTGSIVDLDGGMSLN